MISFVVPAYNEEQFIGRTLAAIHAAARAAGRPYEVIVVDDGSTDATAAIARAHGAAVVPVALRHIAGARNAGAHAARGATLVFVDADTVVPPATLLASLAALEAGAVAGGAIVEFDGRLPRWAILLVPLLRGAMTAAGFAAGCYLFCTREAFAAAGGFDASLYAAEEIYFSRAVARHGRVAILRERVVTSGRKLRSHSPRDLLRLTGSFLVRGTDAVRSRQRLELWYGERRPDVE